MQDTGSGRALPLLAHVLGQLTEHAGPGARIGLPDYRRIGGVRGALCRQAEATLQQAVTATGLPAEEILVALTELVTVDGAGTRGARRIRRSAVRAPMLPAFDLFVDARLLRSGTDGGEPELARRSRGDALGVAPAGGHHRRADRRAAATPAAGAGGA